MRLLFEIFLVRNIKIPRQYLPVCLDSVLAQTEPNWEAILIDDGATDNSGMICDSYAVKDSRFRVIHKENGGAASAKNVGLDAAQGEYLAFVDSDDWVEPNWLEKMLSTLEKSNADVVECDFLKEYRTHSDRGNDDNYFVGIYSAQEYLSFYLQNWTCSLFWNKLFKAELTKDIRFRRERRCIDDEFYTYKVISGAAKIVRIEDQLYHYRQRASSAVSSQKNRMQITDDAMEILIERYTWIADRFPELRKKYLQHDVDIMFYFAHEFDFCDETRIKFKIVSAYYLKQCLRYWANLSTLRNALKLNLSISKKLPPHMRVEGVQDLSDYYC